MGHIRLGRLPKSRNWSQVFDTLDDTSLSPPQLASAVSKAAKDEISDLQHDAGINYCFWTLVRVVSAARKDDFASELERLGIRANNLTSGLIFVQRVAQAVERQLGARGLRSVLVQL